MEDVAKHPSPISILFFSSVTILLIFCFTIILSSIGFLNHLSLTPFHLPIAILLSISYTIFLHKKHLLPAKVFWSMLFMVGIFVVSFTIAHFAYDFTGDGHDYHLTTSILLFRGWNPFTIPNVEWFTQYRLPPTIAHHDTWFLYISHYVKGYETMIASISKLLGTLVNPFALSIPLAIATFGLSYHVISKHFAKCHRYTRIAIGLIIVLNPVAVSQLGSSMVDGIIGYLLTIFTLLSLDYAIDKCKISLILLNLTSIIIIATKLTGLIYIFIAFAIFCYLLLTKATKSASQYALSLAISALFAIIIVSYNPYITNIIYHHGDIFYPTVTFDKTQIKAAIPITVNAQFKQKNRFEKFAISIFSNGVKRETKPEVVFPFPTIVRLFSVQRFGGFGAQYGILFLLSLVLMLLTKNRLFLFINCAILASIFINPECWWARYVPQAWLLPSLSALGFIYDNRSTKLTHQEIAYLAIIIITSFLSLQSLIPQLQSYFKTNHQLNQFAQKVIQSHQKVIIDNSYCNLGTSAIALALKKRHVSVEYADTLHCKVPNNHGAYSKIQQTIPISISIRYCLEDNTPSQA